MFEGHVNNPLHVVSEQSSVKLSSLPSVASEKQILSAERY